MGYTSCLSISREGWDKALGHSPWTALLKRATKWVGNMQSYKLSQLCAAVIVSTNRLVLPELLGLPTAEAPFTQNHCPALLANGIFFGCLPLAELESTDSALSQDGAATTPFFLLYLLKQIWALQRSEHGPGPCVFRTINFFLLHATTTSTVGSPPERGGLVHHYSISCGPGRCGFSFLLWQIVSVSLSNLDSLWLSVMCKIVGIVWPFITIAHKRKWINVESQPLKCWEPKGRKSLPWGDELIGKD